MFQNPPFLVALGILVVPSLVNIVTAFWAPSMRLNTRRRVLRVSLAHLVALAGPLYLVFQLALGSASKLIERAGSPYWGVYSAMVVLCVIAFLLSGALVVLSVFYGHGDILGDDDEGDDGSGPKPFSPSPSRQRAGPHTQTRSSHYE